MAHRHRHEADQSRLRDVIGNDFPWGVEIVVVGGDFRQFIAVVRKGTRAAVVSACLTQSPLWRGMRLLQPTTNMRVLRAGIFGPSLQEFCSWQMRIGNRAGEGARGDSVDPPPKGRCKFRATSSFPATTRATSSTPSTPTWTPLGPTVTTNPDWPTPGDVCSRPETTTSESSTKISCSVFRPRISSPSASTAPRTWIAASYTRESS